MVKGLPDDTHLILSFYECPCGEIWSGVWDSGCDDDCPACGTTCSPTDSDDDPQCECSACEAERAERIVA